jgi:hypothetical protein
LCSHEKPRCAAGRPLSPTGSGARASVHLRRGDRARAIRLDGDRFQNCPRDVTRLVGEHMSDIVGSVDGNVHPAAPFCMLPPQAPARSTRRKQTLAGQIDHPLGYRSARPWIAGVTRELRRVVTPLGARQLSDMSRSLRQQSWPVCRRKDREAGPRSTLTRPLRQLLACPLRKECSPPASTQSFAADVKHLNHQLRHIDGSRSVAQDAGVSEHWLRNHMTTVCYLVKGNDRRRSARPQESIR